MLLEKKGDCCGCSFYFFDFKIRVKRQQISGDILKKIDAEIICKGCRKDPTKLKTTFLGSVATLP